MMRRADARAAAMRVRPYYLYQCDPISGSAHFRTPVAKGLEIIAGLRGHTTGYAVPTYVIDAPGGGGKIPLLPDYVVGREGDDLLLRNYEGGIYRYPDSQSRPSRAGRRRPARAAQEGGTMRIGSDLRSALRLPGRGLQRRGDGRVRSREHDRRDRVGAAASSATRPSGSAMCRDLMARLLDGERWDLVFNIAEGLRGFGREAQVPAMLDAYGIPYTFSDPLVSALTLHKGMAKHVLRDVGVPTADFRVVASDAEARAVDLPFPLFVKPVAEGTGKGIDGRSLVETMPELVGRCRSLLRAARPAGPGRALPAGPRVHRRDRRHRRSRAGAWDPRGGAARGRGVALSTAT